MGAATEKAAMFKGLMTGPYRPGQEKVAR